MFDLSKKLPAVWPDWLTPNGVGEPDKEDFDEWWARHSDTLPHLDPLLCEQWIHRHWTQSPFAFLQLDDLTCQSVKMAPDEIFGSIHREWAQTLNPKHDLSVFQQKIGGKKHPTAAAIDDGTWDFPIITLSTPDGVRGLKGEFPEMKLVLVEGHQRHRYLHALYQFEKAPQGPHEVFVLESPIVTNAGKQL